MSKLGPFPVDDEALNNLEEALNASYIVVEGEHQVVGAEFTVSELLDFYSGYDKEKLVAGEDGWFTYPDPIYSIHDVVRALIKEIRKLRAEVDSLSQKD